MGGIDRAWYSWLGKRVDGPNKEWEIRKRRNYW